MGRDYTVQYSANKKATNGEKTAKAVITGKGNYTKKLTAYYAIKPLDLSDVAISAVTAYDGMKAGKVKVVVLDKNQNALKTSQYTLNIYKDKSGRIPYEANELLKADITTKGKTITRTYTGQEIALSASDLIVTVKINGVQTTLEPDTDYIVTAHSNNINKGTATAVIQGVGTYSGTRTVKFKITAKTFSLTEWINKLLFH